MKIQVVLVALILLNHCAHGLVPKFQLARPQNSGPGPGPTATFHPTLGCCYPDTCVQNQICAHPNHILTDACNRTYEVSNNCELLSMRCCQSDPCSNGQDKCVKLDLKSKPKMPLPKDDIFCSGTKKLLDENADDQCSSTSPIKPIDIIAKGTQAEFERILLRDSPSTPFKVERSINSTAVTLRMKQQQVVRVKEMVTKKSIRSPTDPDIEFAGCHPSANGECVVEITVVVENTISTPTSQLETMVTDASEEIEDSVEFGNLFQTSSLNAPVRKLVFTARAIACTRYKSAYFCLTYYCDVM